MHYFDRKLRPLAADRYQRLSEDPEYTQVALDVLSSLAPRVVVSTIWIGFDIGFRLEDEPVIFESMWLCDGKERDSEQTGSEDAALKAHARLIARATETMQRLQKKG